MAHVFDTPTGPGTEVPIPPCEECKKAGFTTGDVDCLYMERRNDVGHTGRRHVEATHEKLWPPESVTPYVIPKHTHCAYPGCGRVVTRKRVENGATTYEAHCGQHLCVHLLSSGQYVGVSLRPWVKSAPTLNVGGVTIGSDPAVPEGNVAVVQEHDGVQYMDVSRWLFPTQVDRAYRDMRRSMRRTIRKSRPREEAYTMRLYIDGKAIGTFDRFDAKLKGTLSKKRVAAGGFIDRLLHPTPDHHDRAERGECYSSATWQGEGA